MKLFKELRVSNRNMDNRLLKKIYYGLKASINEILSFLTWGLIGFIAFKLYDRPDLNFTIYILILGSSHLLLIFIRGRDADFAYFPFLSSKEHSNWIGNGSFEHVNSALAFKITNSHNGFIYSKTLHWVNYRANFKFKIVNESVGIILRAVDLSNYVMFQIFEDHIKPHIRVNGLWVVYDSKRTANPPFLEHVTINPKLSKDKWYQLRTVCDKSLITMSIQENRKDILDRTWTIPQGTVLFPLMIQPSPMDIPFPMNLDYGTIGFRNHGEEMAFVKDLLVEKI
jgi:hypothetical protein